jgi:hypothetical protein
MATSRSSGALEFVSCLYRRNKILLNISLQLVLAKLFSRKSSQALDEILLTLGTRSIVIEHLEALSRKAGAKICVCYVYFRYSDRSEVTVRNILETLVLQTLERHPECLALAQQTYDPHLRERTDPTEAQLLALLRQFTDLMTITFYVLDALDEAPTKVRLAILKALASLDVKLFITSRPLKTVEASFPSAHTFHIIAQDADLDLHIAKAIEENAELQSLLQVEPALRDEIFLVIKRNCGGM